MRVQVPKRVSSLEANHYLSSASNSLADMFVEKLTQTRTEYMIL